jgi:hypothetical protein
MFSPHAAIEPPKDNPSAVTAHYGYGWTLKDEADSHGETATVARHGGALACTAASLMHLEGGTNVAVLFNLGQSADGKFFGRQIEQPLTDLIRAAPAWPKP